MAWVLKTVLVIHLNTVFDLESLEIQKTDKSLLRKVTFFLLRILDFIRVIPVDIHRRDCANAQPVSQYFHLINLQLPYT